MHAERRVGVLGWKEKEELNAIAKNYTPQRFSSTIETDRGLAADGNGLRNAVARPMELLIPRLVEDQNGHAKVDL